MKSLLDSTNKRKKFLHFKNKKIMNKFADNFYYEYKYNRIKNKITAKNILNDSQFNQL